MLEIQPTRTRTSSIKL